MGGVEHAAIASIAARCGASLPGAVIDRFAGVGDVAAAHEVAAEVAAEHIDRLRREGLARFYLYTLNRSELALEVCRRIGHPQRLTHVDRSTDPQLAHDLV